MKNQAEAPAPPSLPAALQALLTGLIDYAGMFPPAKLSLEDATKNFLTYAASPNAWMLGKFVLPAERLEDLPAAIANNKHFPLTVLLGPEPKRDAEVIQKSAGRLSIESVEFRPGSPSMVHELAAVLPENLPVFCEVPLTENLTDWLTAIHHEGWFAKIRTGGITPDSFPTSAAVANFLSQCKADGIAFKATAGLHHPVRSEHPLTYESSSPCGVMHGFLNVFLGAALLECGVSQDQLISILDDANPANFRFSGDFAHWGKLFVNTNDIAGTREHFAISFGSCSFLEPIQDLQKLKLLDP